MTERGQSPPDFERNKVGEGSGHKVKRGGKGCGYTRSTHMKGDVGPSSGHGGGGGSPHTGFLTTDEHKGHGSAHKLPGEDHIPFRKGVAKGDNFESEINDHFPTKKGVAGINKTAMHHSGKTVVESESVSHDHGTPSGKAEHHTQSLGETYKFKQPMVGMAHSFGHDNEQKHGNLRLSGHKSAHRLGSRSSRVK